MAEMTGVPAINFSHYCSQNQTVKLDAATHLELVVFSKQCQGWGSTATVDDQIQSAYNAYSNQGLSAWGYSKEGKPSFYFVSTLTKHGKGS